mgnify:CR=1 FL=1
MQYNSMLDFMHKAVVRVVRVSEIRTAAVATMEGTDTGPSDLSLTCALCGSWYTDPRRLQCKHSFCYQCLLRSKEGGKSTCPTCGTDCIPEENLLELQQDEELTDAIRSLIRQSKSWIYPTP